MLAAKDMVLDFRAAGADGYCRARLYNGRERPVVLLSQLAETGGPSMAKAIEFIIPQASELLGITPETNPAFVEHYDSRSRTFRPMDGVTFDLVEVVNGRIAYKHLGTEGMEKLVGIPALNELIEQHCLLQAAR